MTEAPLGPHPLEAFLGGIGDIDPNDLPHGRPAQHEVGVGYFAPWELPFDGFNEHSRRSALALASAGVPVQLRSINPGGQLPFDGHGQVVLSEARRQVAERMRELLSTTVSQYAVQVYQVVGRAQDFGAIVARPMMDVDAARTVNRYTVVYTVFERTTLPEHFVEPLRHVGQVWVACQLNADALERAGLDRSRIRVVPMPYFDDDPLLEQRTLERLPGKPRFYHIGKWEPRKQQHRIVGAFLQAFKPSEANLYVKTSASSPPMNGYPRTPADSVHEWCSDPVISGRGWTIEKVNRDVFFITEPITEKRMRQLHRNCDVYVTISQGEGFDMPAFDSKLAGNRMVYTPSGGPADFHAPDDLLVQTTGEVPPHPVYGWSAGSRYLDYRIADAVVAMRRAAELVRGGTAPELADLSGYRAEEVGRRMRAHLEEVLDGPLCP